MELLRTKPITNGKLDELFFLIFPDNRTALVPCTNSDCSVSVLSAEITGTTQRQKKVSTELPKRQKKGVAAPVAPVREYGQFGDTFNQETDLVAHKKSNTDDITEQQQLCNGKATEKSQECFGQGCVKNNTGKTLNSSSIEQKDADECRKSLCNRSMLTVHHEYVASAKTCQCEQCNKASQRHGRFYSGLIVKRRRGSQVRLRL